MAAVPRQPAGQSRFTHSNPSRGVRSQRPDVFHAYRPEDEQRSPDDNRDELGDVRRARACQSCRASKVRCDQPNPGRPCIRCEKAHKPCVAIGQTGRRQARSTGHVITELEARIDALASSIQGPNEAGGSRLASAPASESQSVAHSPNDGSSTRGSPSLETGTRSSLAPSEHQRSPPAGIHSRARSHGASVTSARSMPSPTGTPQIASDFDDGEPMTDPQAVIDKMLAQNLDEATATNIFNRYVTDMAPNLPIVVFPPGTKASEVRESQPIIFLAILDVASPGFCELNAQRTLRKLLVQVYFHCMLRSGEYTLGLLQALIVSATWYRPIEPLQPGEQLDIYQLSHTAANVALIMGLGQKLGRRSWGGPLPDQDQNLRGLRNAVQAQTLEARRVWLGCHYICAK
ncbi:MAG: hypothetical protein M1837_003028 [Sclerophora amabilis]|nr:MAG: hypothetical protein M1837_003028 [Sclerophora amabilis]